LGATLISTKWIEKRKPYWNRLEVLLQSASLSSLKSLSRSELQELSLLYRQTASDLAFVREDPSSIEFTRYLNQLLSRAHGTIYISRKTGFNSIVTFFTRSYPQIFRKNMVYCIVAFSVFLLGSLMGGMVALKSRDFRESILGPEMMKTIERREMWTHSILAVKPYASSAIATNNITVSFFAFAGSLTAGIYTLFTLFFNGFLLGIIGVACGIAGMSSNFWSFVAPHGVLELPAVFIAGGSGLIIAKGLLFPGVLPRQTSLLLAGKSGVKLVVGIVPILLIAGLIEAFVSPTDIPIALKFLMAAALFILLISYLSGFWIRKEDYRRLRSLTSR
jgi:uncharacterized membrane protein SpoIIM required for sporulation